jgi:RND superfamily putative drug exporter
VLSISTVQEDPVATQAPPAPPQSRVRTRSAVGRAGLILLALVVWLLVGAFGGMAQGTLSEVQENDNAAFLPANAESTRAGELSAQFSDETTLPALVVVEAADGGTLGAGQVEAVAAFAEAVPDIVLPGGGALGDVLTGPVVAVPSEDGAAVLVPVPLDATVANELVGEGEERVVNAAVAELRALAGDQLAGVSTWVTGPAGAIADLVTAFGGIDGILLLTALVVVFVILILVYRSPSLPFAVLLTSVFALAAAALVIKPLAGGGVLQLNGQSQGILSILVVGAATDYSLLLVARYREELTRHAHPADAMKVAWRASLEPVLASAGTVIVGLLCLLLSDLGSNSSLGPVAAIGIASAVLAALTLLPAFLLLAGRRSRFIFWPRTPRYAGADVVDGAHVATRGSARPGIWERVATFVTSHARPVWVVTALVLLAAAAFVPTLRAEGTSDSDIFLAETESVAGEAVLAEHFDAGQVQPAVVITAEANAADVIAAAEAVPGVTGASIVTAASGPPAGVDTEAGPPAGVDTEAGPPAGVDTEAGPPAGVDTEAEPVVVDGLVRIDVVTEDAAETQAAVATVRELRTAVHAADADALVGGAAAQRLDTQDTAAKDLRTIIPVVLVAIFLMLVLLLRAVVAPLVLLLANLLSFGATMGISAIVFNHVLDLPGADATVPLYGFVFLVALGIDYSIFLMTRVREESLVRGTREGVHRGLAVTGGVITSAGLVLAATFSALAVIPLLFLLQLAFIVAFGVLLDTFVVRSLLVPGLVHDLGRRTWWPWQRRVPQD